MRSPMFYKPNILRRVLIAAGITAAALALVFSANFIASYYFNQKPEVPVNDQPTVTPLNFELEPGISYENAANESALYFYSAENMKIVNTSGASVEDISLKMSHPTASCKGNFALFYDVGGRTTATFNGTKQVGSMELEENIALASVNAGGYALIVTAGDMYKCAVRVYTPDGKEIFKWNSGNLSVVAADIADNNKDITVSAVNTDGATVNTQIIMFNIAKEKPFANDTYEAKLYPIVCYSGGYTYCIGSTETLIYNSYGKCVGTAVYDDRVLLSYALDGDLFALAFSGSTETPGAYAEIKTYTHKGDESGSFTCRQEFDFLEAKDGSLALNDGRTISILNSHCREKQQLTLGFDLRNFVFFGNAHKGVGITASGAELIQLN